MGVPAPSRVSPYGVLRVATAGSSSHLSRLARSGRAWALAPRLYVEAATLPPADVARHHALAVIDHIWPGGAVVCDQSGLRGPVPIEGWLFICHPDPPRHSDLRLPGLVLSPRVGPGPLPGDIPLPEVAVHQAGQVRALVENVGTAGRPPVGRPARRAGTTAVEDRLDELARTGGAGRIKTLLDQLDVIAGSLPVRPVELVRARLAQLLGTRGGRPPASPRLAARLSGEPFDSHRLDLMASLVATLERTAPQPRPALGDRWRWEPFFEAYFSNYIEGTEFGVEEARRIALDGEVPVTRPQDAHDVAATYRLVIDPELSRQVPSNAEELFEILRARHAVLMAARPTKGPGEFKATDNFAGGYRFVEPDLLTGTLRRGYACLAPLTDPLHRAIGIMFLLTECHPFDDGNGRVARLLANAELSHAGQVRLIIPTVFRDNYLAALSGTSRGAGQGESLVSTLSFAQKWTAAVDWSTYETAKADIESSNGFLDARSAESAGLRLRLASR